MKTKVAVLLSGALVALLLLSRYFALSRVGIRGTGLGSSSSSVTSRMRIGQLLALRTRSAIGCPAPVHHLRGVSVVRCSVPNAMSAFAAWRRRYLDTAGLVLGARGRVFCRNTLAESARLTCTR